MYSDYKIIIWGHKLHSHTHSYVHNGFYEAFKYLGYKTYWFDNKDDVSNFSFEKSIFITECQVDQKIPLRKDCFSDLHNCRSEKYLAVDIKFINIQVYTDDVILRKCNKIDDFIYSQGNCLYFPWATDILPEQIEKNKEFVEKTNEIYWVGTIGAGEFGNITELQPFMDECKKNKIKFIQKSNVSRDENMKFIKKSLMAPAIVGPWQKKKGYIPCRIFKNISYGQMGITNSKNCNSIFQNKLIFNENTSQLFYDARKKLKEISKEDIYFLMDIVKNKHTYINRINLILNFIKENFPDV